MPLTVCSRCKCKDIIRVTKRYKPVCSVCRAELAERPYTRG